MLVRYIPILMTTVVSSPFLALCRGSAIYGSRQTIQAISEECKRLLLLVDFFLVVSAVFDVYFENAEWTKMIFSHHPLNYFGTSPI